MFILFGLQKKTSTQGPIVQSKCYHCKNHVSWHHYKITDWFELFFIPVIPFKSEHYLACEICGDAVQLDGEESRGAEGFHKMDAPDREEWRQFFVERLEDHQFENMSETQRNWHREEREDH